MKNRPLRRKALKGALPQDTLRVLPAVMSQPFDPSQDGDRWLSKRPGNTLVIGRTGSGKCTLVAELLLSVRARKRTQRS